MAEGVAVLRLLRRPGGITVIVVAALAAVIWLDQTHDHPGSMAGKPAAISAKSPSPSPQSTLSAPALGGELPAIVKRYGNAPQTPGTTPSPTAKMAAPGLENLLAGLESKVKGDPTNVSNRILLAQTYQELGFRDKALNEARDIAEKNPSHLRARLVLASILSKSQQQAELKEAVTLLDSLRSQAEVKQFLVQMYLGDALIRMGDHQNALANWKSALESMPAMDNRREELQQRIKNLGSNA